MITFPAGQILQDKILSCRICPAGNVIMKPPCGNLFKGLANKFIPT